MKTLYLECRMGAAGDMLMSALLELVENPMVFVEKMNGLGLDGVHLHKKESVKCGIVGTHVEVHVHGHEETSEDVHVHDHSHNHEHERHHVHVHNNESHDHNHEHTHDHNHEHHGHHAHEHNHDHEHIHNHDHDHVHEHHHSGIADMVTIIQGLPVSQKVKDNGIAIYQLIADAEAKAHGKPVSQVHFHEVGAMDAVADIIGVCLLMEELAPEQVIVSPIHLGRGFVRCAHGVLPVPAPATAHILQGVPTYCGDIKGELCTPTGAAIVKHFASRFSEMPVMITEKIGYGMGNKDFEAANCVRAFIGHADNNKNNAYEGTNGDVAELCCNIDDMTGEDLGYALDILFENGAHDVFTTPIFMKKSRPGIMFTCICEVEKADEMACLIMKHTSTLGIRKTICSRYMLERTVETITTEYGEIRIKTGSGYGITKTKAEYEDIAKIAKSNSVTLSAIRKGIQNAQSKQ